GRDSSGREVDFDRIANERVPDVCARLAGEVADDYEHLARGLDSHAAGSRKDVGRSSLLKWKTFEPALDAKKRWQFPIAPDASRGGSVRPSRCAIRQGSQITCSCSASR